MADRRQKTRSVSLFLVATLALSLNADTRGDDCNFLNPGDEGDAFSNASNWTCGHIPNAADRVIFNNSADYWVLFTQNITNDRLRISNDNVDFLLFGKTYTLTSTTSTSLSIGGSVVIPPPPLPVAQGFLTFGNGTINSVNTLIGAANFGYGQVTANANAIWNNSGTLGVGTLCPGALIIDGAADVTTASATIGGNNNGTATVSGTGSTWTVNGALNFEKGTLGVQSGGLLTSGGTTIGGGVGHVATATVGNAVNNSVWTCNGPLVIGGGGTGTLNVQANGLLDSDLNSTATVIADWDNAVGAVNVSGNSARWFSRGISVGILGAGSLTIGPGGLVSSSGSCGIGLSGLGSGNVSVTGPNASWNITQNPLGVGGSWSAPGGPGTLTVGPGGVVRSSLVNIWSQGTVNLNGGELLIGGLGNNGGTFDWTDGILETGGMPEFVIGPTGPLGANRTLIANSQLLIGGPDGTLVIGQGGMGTLSLVDSAHVFASYLVIGNHNSASNLSLNGANVSMDLSYALTAGKAGTGIITISNGAMLSNRLNPTTHRCATLGESAGKTGWVNVHGLDSLWDCSGFNIDIGEVVIADAGFGVMNVTGGGAVVNDFASVTLALVAGSLAEISITSDSSWTIDRDLIVAEAGTASLTIESGGEVSCDSAILGRLDTSNGTMIVDGAGSVFSSPGLTVAGEGEGTLTVRNGGAVQADTLTLTGYPGGIATVTVEGPNSRIDLQGAFGYLLVGGAGSATLDITGGASVDALETFIGDGSTGNGTVNIAGAGSTLTSVDGVALGFFNGSVGALHINSGARAITPIGQVGTYAGTSGMATVDGAGSQWSLAESLDVGGGVSGQVQISNAGVVSTVDAAIHANGVITLAGGSLNAATVEIDSGVLRGAGAVAAEVTNAGSVSPGQSAGILNITGSYTQSAAGMLAIELGGTTAGAQHDRLAITGFAALGGSLQLSLINGFVPAVGNTFTILTAASISGTFATVTFTNLPPSLSASVSYSSNSVVVSIIGDSIAGDLNCDGALNTGDVAPFALALTDPAAYLSAFPGCDIHRADMNADGLRNGHDVKSFINALINP